MYSSSNFIKHIFLNLTTKVLHFLQLSICILPYLGSSVIQYHHHASVLFIRASNTAYLNTKGTSMPGNNPFWLKRFLETLWFWAWPILTPFCISQAQKWQFLEVLPIFFQNYLQCALWYQPPSKIRSPSFLPSPLKSANCPGSPFLGTPHQSILIFCNGSP